MSADGDANLVRQLLIAIYSPQSTQKQRGDAHLVSACWFLKNAKFTLFIPYSNYNNSPIFQVAEFSPVLCVYSIHVQIVYQMPRWNITPHWRSSHNVYGKWMDVFKLYNLIIHLQFRMDVTGKQWTRLFANIYDHKSETWIHSWK
jgi:hypothetical protein